MDHLKISIAKKDLIGKNKKNIFNVLPSEIVEEILILLDISSIKSYYSIKSSICNHSFWKKLYMRDNLQYYKKDTIADYLHTYDCIKNIKLQINIIFKMIECDNIENIHVSSSKNMKYRHRNGIFHVYINHDCYVITLYHYDIILETDERYPISKDELKNLLTDILFHYPNTKIDSGSYYSTNTPMLKKDLIHHRDFYSKHRLSYYIK